MEPKFIKITHAKENNLKNISIDIPKNQLVVITGVSGSGKSSLAFDVLYSEGRRRYINSLSNYARQFLGGSSKPNVESIEGLSPTIAIDQKTTSNNPRSTVGTITEIYDFYRLLFARIGESYCPNHHIKITSQSFTQILDQLYTYKQGVRLNILAPIVRNEKGSHKEVIDKLRKQGFLRLKIDNEIYKLTDEIDLDKNKFHNISIVIDRIILDDENRSRLFEALQVTAEHAGGLIEIENLDSGKSELFSKNFACPHGDFSIPKIEPRMFSFNAPQGACPSCKGLGFQEKVIWPSLVDETKSVNEGGIKFFHDKLSGIDFTQFKALTDFYKISLDKKLSRFSDSEKEIVLYGSKEPLRHFIEISGSQLEKFDYIEGLADKIFRRYMATTSELARAWYKKFLGEEVCQLCHGKKLNQAALSVKVNDIDIYDLTSYSITDALIWVNNLKLTADQKQIIVLVIEELRSRLGFLINVGLGYLSMGRLAQTLSGGEAQRIRLASQLGSKLTGVIYVLDEPSIGLHQRDNNRLIATLKEIRDIGNSVVVVEHDEETLLAADYLIDVGPFAGLHGGEIVGEGTPNHFKKLDTLTAKFLSGAAKIAVPNERRTGNGKFLQIVDAQENNLKNLTVTIPLNTFTAITGVSGSGKSTLINQILYPAIYNRVTKFDLKLPIGKVLKIEGIENIDKVVAISQDPIGKTPRSNPATYTGVFDDIRDFFANTTDSKIKGFTRSRFSFNVDGGRCEVCKGDGLIKISMHFLPDVYITCSECKGTRYNEETLQVRFKGKNIADVLGLSIDEAIEFFANNARIAKKIQFLADVGVGYLKLGHSSTLLSGGEAQRIKLATYLQKKPTGKTLYILDEPTTGLHNYDIEKLLAVLNRLVDGGDSIILIEHNLDVIKTADYVIDLGPEGGDQGGEVIAVGTPEKVAGVKKSFTGQYLKNVLRK